MLGGVARDHRGDIRGAENGTPMFVVRAPTDDPVLLFRSPSYAVSFVKRLQGQ